MKKLIYIFLVVCGFLILEPAHAQSFFSLQYSMGFSAGDQKAFITTPSFRGFTMEFRSFLNENVALGGEVGWNVFYERRAYDTYTSGTTSLAGVQYRYTNSVPIYFAGDYYFKPNEKVNPFIGMGVGTLFSSRRTDMGIFTTSEEAWQFAIRPEVGVRLGTSPDADVIIALKYHTGFATDNFAGQSFLSVNLGFVFKHGF